MVVEGLVSIRSTNGPETTMAKVGGALCREDAVAQIDAMRELVTALHEGRPTCPQSGDHGPSCNAFDRLALPLENEWRRPAQTPALEASTPKSHASRWIAKAPCLQTLRSDVTDHYTIALSLRRTTAMLSRSGQKFHDGDIGAGYSHITGPNEPISALFRSASDFVHFFLDSRFVTQCAEEMEVRNAVKPAVVGPDFRSCLVTEHLLRSLIIIPAQEQRIHQLYIDGISITIAAQLLALSQQHKIGLRKSGPQPLPKWRLRRVLAFIESNLADSITLPDLAETAGLTRMHFAAQFRAATGSPPHAFVLRKRIEHAQELLAKNRITLTEIAFDCGFQTQSHFTTVFKKFTGQTPKQWSDNHHLRGQMLRAAPAGREGEIKGVQFLASCNQTVPRILGNSCPADRLI